MSFEQSLQEWQALSRHRELKEATKWRPKMVKVARREAVELQRIKTGQESRKPCARIRDSHLWGFLHCCISTFKNQRIFKSLGGLGILVWASEVWTLGASPLASSIIAGSVPLVPASTPKKKKGDRVMVKKKKKRDTKGGEQGKGKEHVPTPMWWSFILSLGNQFNHHGRFDLLSLWPFRRLCEGIQCPLKEWWRDLGKIAEGREGLQRCPLKLKKKKKKKKKKKGEKIKNKKEDMN